MAELHDETRCERHAPWIAHMEGVHFHVMYWGLFIANLLILFVASWFYIRAQETVEAFKGLDDKRLRKVLLRYIGGCVICVLVSTGLIVCEVYALMALQFCEGEDLISLYWSTWTMIQVGSNIAMLGIILALCHSFRDFRHPPWALALGTPVLVIAGLLHLLHDCTKRAAKSFRERRASTTDMLDGTPISQSNTIQVPEEEDEEMMGTHVGFTIDGGPIIRFTHPLQGPLSPSVVWHADDKMLIAFRKGVIKVLTASQMRGHGQDPEKGQAKGPGHDATENQV